MADTAASTETTVGRDNAASTDTGTPAAPRTLGYTFPPFFMPLRERGINPAWNGRETQMYDWGRASALTIDPAVLRQMERTQPDFATAICIVKTLPERFEALCRYVLWVWAVDDGLDERITARDVVFVTETVAELTRAIEGVGEVRSPAARAGREVHELVCAGRSAEWRAEFTAEVLIWLATFVREVAAVRLGTTMSMEEYIPHRRYTSVLGWFMHLGEYALGIDLPHRVRMLPAMVEARHRGAEWIGIYNDVFSVDREDAVGYPFNAVLIAQRERCCSRQEAVNHVNTMLTDLMKRFVGAVERVPAELSRLGVDEGVRARVAQVLETYETQVRGNHDYHRGRPRYVDSPAYLPGEQPAGPRPLYSTDERFATGT
ncbi:terpene synthase family protein [Streptomyces sp. URMC 123]|uniref:terpene synthase family protein n=1 Tax=Streptomyces sp. URMC 123 TaxID=3423403 RepID=UPI003F1C72DF